MRVTHIGVYLQTTRKGVWFMIIQFYLTCLRLSPKPEIKYKKNKKPNCCFDNDNCFDGRPARNINHYQKNKNFVLKLSSKIDFHLSSYDCYISSTQNTNIKDSLKLRSIRFIIEVKIYVVLSLNFMDKKIIISTNLSICFEKCVGAQ